MVGRIWLEEAWLNFLVNNPHVNIFLTSVHASNNVKDANMLFKLLDDVMEEIGHELLIQVITDNASANVVRIVQLSIQIIQFISFFIHNGSNHIKESKLIQNHEWTIWISPKSVE